MDNKRYLKLNLNQTGSSMSVNHQLYNKIIKSKDWDKIIKILENKLLKKMKKMITAGKKLTAEGFYSFKFYLLFSQYTTLKQIEKNPDMKYDEIVNAGELWTKLYFNHLSKKYDNDIPKIKSIIERDI